MVRELLALLAPPKRVVEDSPYRCPFDSERMLMESNNPIQKRFHYCPRCLHKEVEE